MRKRNGNCGYLSSEPPATLDAPASLPKDGINMTSSAALAETTCESFLIHGYAVVRNVIPSAIIANIYAFLQNQIDDAIKAAQSEVGCDSAAALLDHAGKIAGGSHGNTATLSKATRDTVTGHFSLKTRLSEHLWQIPLTLGVQGILKACLDTERIFMHMPPTARFVLPKNSHAGVPPHQDASYNGHMTRFLTMWTPLVDISDECGGVVVYQGSGRSELQDAPDSSNHYWRQPIETDLHSPMHIRMNTGDILLLNQKIIHRSQANQSNRTRISIDYRFFGEQGSSSKHYLDLQTKRVFEPTPDAFELKG
jgi:ectoine hydroxylase-related dioxygenase (phytanoyl-CoA dioxygenase family)